MRLKALFGNVILEKIIPQRASKLILAEHVAESICRRWQVVSVGPECKRIKLGEFVVFNTGTAGEIEDGGKKFIILPEKDIVATYEDRDVEAN